ncbi:hypothetical protein ZHAS_00014822 [Anopheles sinensis]|uniref:Uncharacterized protein n=1 Tax=Anopheles sinensis TaxID=74873 RepID=A0A084W9C1_ANOSI|nr:hypothetical protein ZHAS_00014822 [Anopheles sinensis]
MKSTILYPYGPLRANGCCRMLHAKHLALTSAIYTLNISILVVLLYSWRISVNVKKYSDLEDVYYGVQIAYFAIIGTQCSMILLSVVLIFGIYRENIGLVVPWIIGFITFMALEAVAMVYSNVLRDHVNRQFDSLCKAEVAFFVSRAVINTEKTLASFRDETHLIVRIPGPDADLLDVGRGFTRGRRRPEDGDQRHVDGEVDDEEEEEDDADGVTTDTDDNMIGGRQPDAKSAGSGSDEDDSLLVAYDSNSIASV